MTPDQIIAHFPIKDPYKFIDKIVSLDENSIVANYRFKEREFFYRGHFDGYPITPGAILTECAVQVGLLAFGIHLIANGYASLIKIPSQILEIPSELEANMNIEFDHISLPVDIDRTVLFYRFFLVSSDMHFKSLVRPNETVSVCAEKIYFKMNKLKCKVSVSVGRRVAAKGIVSGIVIDTRV